jgi:hypothetical protein
MLARGTQVDVIHADPVASDKLRFSHGLDGLRADRRKLCENEVRISYGSRYFINGPALGGNNLAAQWLEDLPLYIKVGERVVGNYNRGARWVRSHGHHLSRLSACALLDPSTGHATLRDEHINPPRLT